jgi:trans-2,3-dihydro-3-hydroxyanthranilate isomerase
VPLEEPVTKVSLELGVGVLPAELHVAGGEVERVVMTQGRPTFHATVTDLVDLVEGLGVQAGAILETGLPVQVVSTGMPQMMVPLRSLEEVQAVDPCRINVSALTRACEAAGTDCVFVFSLETEQPEATVHVRLFAPMLGIPEDPATGSANGALGAYLVHYQAVPVIEPTTSILSEQGSEMGRPSKIFVEVDSAGEEISAVRVGGQVTLVAEGDVRFPGT